MNRRFDDCLVYMVKSKSTSLWMAIPVSPHSGFSTSIWYELICLSSYPSRPLLTPTEELSLFSATFSMLSSKYSAYASRISGIFPSILLSFPTIGAATIPRSSSSQSTERKNGCSFTSCASRAPPSRVLGSFRSSYPRSLPSAPLCTANRWRRSTPSTEYPRACFGSGGTSGCDPCCRTDTRDHHACSL